MGPWEPRILECIPDVGPWEPWILKGILDVGPWKPRILKCILDMGPWEPRILKCILDAGPWEPRILNCILDAGPWGSWTLMFCHGTCLVTLQMDLKPHIMVHRPGTAIILRKVCHHYKINNLNVKAHQRRLIVRPYRNSIPYTAQAIWWWSPLAYTARTLAQWQTPSGFYSQPSSLRLRHTSYQGLPPLDSRVFRSAAGRPPAGHVSRTH